MTVIDAKNLILGRMASKVAKRALLGEEINIINCEHAVISGHPDRVFEHYKQKADRGTHKGPFLPRNPDRFVRRTIRGMFDYKQQRGKAAFKRVMCYPGVPKAFENQKAETLKAASADNLSSTKFTTVLVVCKKLGGKI